MLGFAKAFLVVFAVSGIAMTGAGAAGIVQLPMERAIENHLDHLMSDSPMPDRSSHGQQTSLDQLRLNQERWIAKHAVPDEKPVEDDELGPIFP
jgi:hypothetical protein